MVCKASVLSDFITHPALIGQGLGGVGKCKMDLLKKWVSFTAGLKIRILGLRET